MELLDGIEIDVPIYGVLGNHEEFSERKDELIRGVRRHQDEAFAE